MDTAAVRQLALGWRWWAAYGTSDAGEQFAWRQAAMELEDLAGLPHPDRDTVDREGRRSDTEKARQAAGGYALVHKRDMNAALGCPGLCYRSAEEITADLGSGRYWPLEDCRVLRLNDGRVELAYTAHEWMREMT